MPKVSTKRVVLKRATILDVAQVCGLSATTISKVMNLPPEKLDVPETTRQRVLEACRHLNYQPSWRARALQGGRTHTIGIIHREAIPTFYGLWHRIVAKLTECTHDLGYDVQLVPTTQENDRWRQLMLDHRFDGYIVFHELCDMVAKVLTEAQLPAVLLNARREGFAHADPDDAQGCRDLTKHLIARGHQRIAYWCSTKGWQHFSYAERIAGYKQAMEEAGLTSHIRILDSEVSSVLDQLRNVEEPSTAVITYSEMDAVPLLRNCWSRKVRVPEDLAVCTFNNVWVNQNCIPPLTTMDVPAEGLAETAVRMLLQQMEAAEKGAPIVPERVVLPETLIARESTGESVGA